MRRYWRQIRSNWNRTDTCLLIVNTLALVGFIGNCWWQSAWVCCALSIAAIAILTWLATNYPGALRESLAFGALVALGWPLGEGIITELLGWWGIYLAPGPMIWHTPLYCMLIGWLASAHVYYVGRRTLEMGFSMPVSMANAGITALLLGTLGENLFVWARMWTYYPSAHDWFSVPAFVPVAYGLGYSILPLSRRWGLVRTTAAWASALTGAAVGLGFLVGFYPR